MYNSHITDPGEWLWFSQRDENKSLTMEQKTQKFLHETSLYQEFLSFQAQQQALSQQQMSGGGANRVFTSTIQLQKAMVGWYTNQGVSDLKYGPIENWDVSRVTSFANVVGGENPFYDFLATYQTTYSQFNRDLSGWDVSSGTSFAGMFFECLAYNNAGVSLSGWDVSSGTNFSAMFSQANEFVGVGVDSWNMSNATDIGQMFSGCKLFNTNLNGWDTSNVTDMPGVFETTPAFNQPLNNWDVSNVTNMSQMFNCQIDGSTFNQPLPSWDTAVKNAKRLDGMFWGSNFDQDISSWDFSSIQGTVLNAAGTGPVTDSRGRLYQPSLDNFQGKGTINNSNSGTPGSASNNRRHT